MDIPWANIVTGAFTVIGVIVANQLSSKQSGQAKLWDLRRPAYGSILSDLMAVEGLCDRADEEIQQYGFLEYFERGSHSIDEQTLKRMTSIRQRFSDDYLVLSDEFVSRFSDFLGELDSAPPDATPDDEHESFSAAVRKHRPGLLAQARKEVIGRRYFGFSP